VTSVTARHPLDDASAMREKVEQDIAFLTDKIDRMMTHSRPNQMLIEHYMGMLKSRQAVLNWLRDGEVQEVAISRTA
jgi:hypothetical protein